MSETQAVDRGIAMRVGMSGGDDGTMIELTAVCEAAASRFDLDIMLDKLTGAARRQRAIAQLPVLRAERDETQKLLDENRVRLAEMKAGHEARLEAFDEQAERHTQIRDRIYVEAERQHVLDGKRVEFDAKQLRGHQKTTYGNENAQLLQISAARQKTEAEHEQAYSQLDNEIKRRTTSVEILDRRIAECEALERGDELDSGANLHDREE